jgi:hypothetical protein
MTALIARQVAEKIGEGFARLSVLREIPGTEQKRAALRQRLSLYNAYYRAQNLDNVELKQCPPPVERPKRIEVLERIAVVSNRQRVEADTFNFPALANME